MSLQLLMSQYEMRSLNHDLKNVVKYMDISEWVRNMVCMYCIYMFVMQRVRFKNWGLEEGSFTS